MTEPKRGRKPIEIDKAEFQQVVSKLEQERAYPTRAALWADVEQTEWAKTRVPRPLTSQVALLKAEELGLEIKTEKGKRGRSKGCGPVSSGGKKKKVFSIQEVKNGIPVEEQKLLEKTLNRAANGSLKARVKLMCMDCTGWQKKEIAECEIKKCPLFDVRPYKRMKVVQEKYVDDNGKKFSLPVLVEVGTNERIGYADNV